MSQRVKPSADQMAGPAEPTLAEFREAVRLALNGGDVRRAGLYRRFSTGVRHARAVRAMREETKR